MTFSTGARQAMITRPPTTAVAKLRKKNRRPYRRDSSILPAPIDLPRMIAAAEDVPKHTTVARLAHDARHGIGGDDVAGQAAEDGRIHAERQSPHDVVGGGGTE